MSERGLTPPMPSELQFPTFLHGTVSSLRRLVKRAGQQWGKAYREQQRFPEPNMEPVPPGTPVHLQVASDLAHERRAWRLYFVQILAGEICEALDWKDSAQISAEFEAFTLTWPWGALDAAVEHVVPNSAPAVIRRLEAVLGFWDPLSALRYIDRAREPVSLDTVMTNHYTGLLDMWLPSRSGSIRQDLRDAIEIMRHASPEDVHRKVIEALARAARKEKRIRHAEVLSNPDWLSRVTAGLDPNVYQGLTAGHVADLLRTLFILDEWAGAAGKK